MQIEEMRLDGNAAAGVLREVFTHEMTTALAKCAGCATMGPVGALLAYGYGMGIVLRCPTCDALAMRVVRTPGFLCLDLSGISLLTIPESDSVS
jgi:hypothetical protein